MNRTRRKEIARIVLMIESKFDELEGIQFALESVRDEEQEAFDNLPEGFQEGQKGRDITDAIDSLDEQINEIETIISSFRETAVQLSESFTK